MRWQHRYRWYEMGLWDTEELSARGVENTAMGSLLLWLELFNSALLLALMLACVEFDVRT